MSSAHRDILASFLTEEPKFPVICDKLKFQMESMSERPIDTIWPSTSEDFEKLFNNGWPKLKAIQFERIGLPNKIQLCGIKMEFTNGLETPLIRARRHQNSQASLVTDGQRYT